MKLEDFLLNYSVEQIKKIPERICQTLIVNISEYKKMVEEKNPEKDNIDKELLEFKKSKDYLGFYNVGENRIYLKSLNYSKNFAEKKIIEFLKEK